MRRIALVALLVMACGDNDPTAVDWRSGTAYRLVSVNGKPLPAVYIVGDYTSWEVIADTIVLRPDGTGTQIAVSRPVYPNAPPGESRRDVRDFTYTYNEERLEIALPCNDVIFLDRASSCVAPPHYAGRLTIDGVLFDVAIGYPTPARFIRIFQ